jgi:hypothetical protein
LDDLKVQRLNRKIKELPFFKARLVLKQILKKLNLQGYYEHIPFILSKITSKPPPTLSREVEDKIKLMFKQIQEPFMKHCPANRINFLNYSYILHKFFELLEMPEFAECFPLLKSRDKLRSQDQIWQHICNDLTKKDPFWRFIESV